MKALVSEGGCNNLAFCRPIPPPLPPPPPHSTSISEVNVTVAGSVCDVQSTNETHIVCVTNSQARSQEARVRVSIGDRGVARMVSPLANRGAWGHG